MGAGEVRVGDIGTIFEVTCKKEDGTAQDISTATTRQILFKKPGGSILTKTGTLVNTGSDGKMKYKTLAADIDEAGSWEIQGRVVLSAGIDEYKSDISYFEVYPNLS